MKRIPVFVARSWPLFLLAWAVAAGLHYYVDGQALVARSFGSALFIWLVAVVLTFVARLFRGLKTDGASVRAMWVIGLVVLAFYALGGLHTQ